VPAVGAAQDAATFGATNIASSSSTTMRTCTPSRINSTVRRSLSIAASLLTPRL
jgi:hypothetical protein